MIVNTPEYEEFCRKQMAGDRLSYEDACRVYESLYEEALAVGAINSVNIWDGMEIRFSGVRTMKISVALDDDLMNTALKLSGLKTKRDTIEEGLRLLIQVSQQSQSKDLRGSLSSRSDLDRVKTDE